MIVTLRTVPRSDGSTSVVLTRAPADARDPEVVTAFPLSRQAVEWILIMVSRISQQAGDRLQGYESRYHVRSNGPCSGTVRLHLDIPVGDELRVLMG